MPDVLLREAMRSSPRIGQVSLDAECLFVRLLTTVCRGGGRFHAAPVLVKAHAFANRPSIRLGHVARLLDELERAGLIHRYSAPNGEPLLWIPRRKQQLKFASRSPFPPPPTGQPDAPGQTAWDFAGENEPQVAGPPEDTGPPPAPPPKKERREERGNARAERAPAPAENYLDRRKRQVYPRELDAQIEAVRNELYEMTYPGGCAHAVRLTGEKLQQAESLRNQLAGLKRQRERMREELASA